MEATGIDPLSAVIGAIAGCCASHGKTPPRFDALADALRFAMAELVEPGLPSDTFVFVYHFPADQAVLASLEPGDPRVARRFEAYFGG